LKIFPLLVGLAVLLTACGGATEAHDGPAGPTPTRAAAALLTPTAGFQPIEFPRDEAPHDMLTEWWYYTGHLTTAAGDRYGFEFVVFQANRFGFPTGYAAHFAITDGQRQVFAYDQRISTQSQPTAERGFDLVLGDWEMRGSDGTDALRATMADYGIDLVATATKPAALHNGTGYVSLGDLGNSYYYSRTRMRVDGTLTDHGEAVAVSGEAWMDHQWGNFIPVGSEGWDWFSVQLDDGTDLMLYLVHDATGALLSTYGTTVDLDGTARDLTSDELRVQPTGSWTSPTSGATYPSGWTIAIPARQATLTLTPTIPNQELDTRASTGVIYWEGEVAVSGSWDGAATIGLGYVELTGYSDR